jgi:UDP-N-acetylmuramate--alanine ligase
MSQPGTETRRDSGSLPRLRGLADIAGLNCHFIGAGGVGMSGLAGMLLKHKAIVTGSDLAGTAVTDALCRMGASIKIGHRRDNVPPAADVVVFSAAIKEDNPELAAARRAGLAVYKYARMLGVVSGLFECIAVSGTHGKSTTGGWLAYCLEQAGLSPSFVIGANVSQLGGSSGTGSGPHFVVEACEYDRSFLNLSPRIACILNIEQDHLDYYADTGEIVAAFGQFARRLDGGGALIVNGDDANAAAVVAALPGSLRCETFGFGANCLFRARGVSLVQGLPNFEVCRGGEPIGRVRIGLPGRHNVLNALAVFAASAAAGVEPPRIPELMEGFTGIERRLMLKGVFGGVTVVDDYAHHPTEIAATLDALRQRYEPRRIWCVFQPHQYSRTRFLLDDFAESFKLADVTIVPEIYFVRDTAGARRRVNSRVLVEKMRRAGSEAMFIESFGEICGHLGKHAAAGDLVVTMGAGDIWKVADEYIQGLREDR